MKTVHDCYEILQKKKRWPFGKEDIAEKLQCLETIKQSGTTSSISFLLQFLRSEHAIIRKKTADAIIFLFKQLTSLNEYENSLKHLDIAETDLGHYRVDFNEVTYGHLLAIASFNRNGFVRQKAVQELSRLKTSYAIKFILIRLGDWVAPVRESAVTALDSFLDTPHIDELLQQLLIIESLIISRRVNLRDIHERIIKFILQQEWSAEFKQRLRRLHDKDRFIYYKNFFRYRHPDQSQLNTILKDRSFLVRNQVLVNLPAFEASIQKEIVSIFLRDRSARIRTTALYASKNFKPAFEQNVRDMLSDQSAVVRDLTRRMLKEQNLDIPAIYRERIASGQWLEGSIQGLAEVGSNSDLPIFEKYIDHESTGVIAGSLTGLYRFAPESGVSHSLRLLMYPSQKVRDIAFQILAKNTNPAVLQSLNAAFLKGNRQQKKTILQLYNAQGGWPVLPGLLIALTDADTLIQQLGWQFLARWKAKALRLFTTASQNIIQKARELYAGIDPAKIHATNDQKRLFEELEFFIQS